MEKKNEKTTMKNFMKKVFYVGLGATLATLYLKNKEVTDTFVSEGLVKGKDFAVKAGNCAVKAVKSGTRAVKSAIKSN